MERDWRMDLQNSKPPFSGGYPPISPRYCCHKQNFFLEIESLCDSIANVLAEIGTFVCIFFNLYLYIQNLRMLHLSKLSCCTGYRREINWYVDISAEWRSMIGPEIQITVKMNPSPKPVRAKKYFWKYQSKAFNCYNLSIVLNYLYVPTL